MDFLINRNQFSASTSINETHKIKSKIPYLNSFTWFNNERLLLFDFKQYLIDKFKGTPQSDSQLCLIMNQQDFTPDAWKLIGKLLSKDSRLSQSYLGLIVPSHAEIHEISLSEIKINPDGIDSLMTRNGIYGCRFSEETRIQYFIDLENHLNKGIKQK